jgi:sulfite exporter TauE/SafE/copper chaperone CopZ
MEHKQKSYTFHIDGMHCKACSLQVESELKDLSYVTEAHADIKTQTLKVTGDFDGVPPEALAEDFSHLLAGHKYHVSVEKKIQSKHLSDFKIALPLAVGFIAVFILLQKIGLINSINATKLSYGKVFLIGVIASLSSCMAVVGGLVLSMSATFAREGDRVRPQTLFHVGRILSFIIFGGLIGLIGSAFHLSTMLTMVLGLVVGLVMLVMGLNLLDVFHMTKLFQPIMPKFISERAFDVSKFNHRVTPLLVGIATFFLPCGFTQSMQVYALSTGSFTTGALTMFAFALGTLPALLLVSFSSFGFTGTRRSRIFFRTAGIIVILFALLGIINSFVVIGILPPFLHL